MAQVLPLAAGAAVSPGLLGLQMLNLARREGPMAWAWSVSIGSAAVLLLATVAAFVFHFSTGGDGAQPEWRGVVKLSGALVLFAIASYELVWAGEGPAPTLTDAGEVSARRGGLRAPGIGLGAVLVVPNLALYFPAAHEIAASEGADAARAVLFVVVFGITMLPVAAPPLAVRLLGERVRPALEGLNFYVTEHRRGVTATACVGFGIALAVSGAIQLL